MKPFLIAQILSIGILGTCLGCAADDLDGLAPSKLTGAQVQARLKSGMTSDELHSELQTTPALVRKNVFHWPLADGSMWTNVISTKRGSRIIGWTIESKSATARGGESEEFDQLFHSFYKNPDPAKLPRILELAAILEMFDKEHLRQPLVAFLAPVFRANPERISNWAQLPELSSSQRQAIYAAIAESGVEESDTLLQRVSVKDERDRAFVEQLLAARPKDVLEREIDAPMDLDTLWAGFFATGDRRYVERICSVFSWDVTGLDRSSPKWLINGAAAWSVGANARQHLIVAQVCKENLKSADERAKPVYEKILAELKRAAE